MCYVEDELERPYPEWLESCPTVVIETNRPTAKKKLVYYADAALSKLKAGAKRININDEPNENLDDLVQAAMKRRNLR